MCFPVSTPQIAFDEFSIDETDEDQKLAEFVAKKVVPHIPQNLQIISIDGFSGTGKSSLSRHLSEQLAFKHINFDDHLVKEQGCFFDALKLDEIKEYMLRGECVAEGCLTAKVLQEIGVQAGYKIYMVRTTRMISGVEHEWIREHEILCSETSTEEIIHRKAELALAASRMPEEYGGGGSGKVPGLEIEEVIYHRDFMPHQDADLLIKIVHWT